MTLDQNDVSAWLSSGYLQLVVVRWFHSKSSKGGRGMDRSSESSGDSNDIATRSYQSFHLYLVNLVMALKVCQRHRFHQLVHLKRRGWVAWFISDHVGHLVPSKIKRLVLYSPDALRHGQICPRRVKASTLNRLWQNGDDTEVPPGPVSMTAFSHRNRPCRPCRRGI